MDILELIDNIDKQINSRIDAAYGTPVVREKIDQLMTNQLNRASAELSNEELADYSATMIKMALMMLHLTPKCREQVERSLLERFEITKIIKSEYNHQPT